MRIVLNDDDADDLDDENMVRSTDLTERSYFFLNNASFMFGAVARNAELNIQRPQRSTNWIYNLQPL